MSGEAALSFLKNLKSQAYRKVKILSFWVMVPFHPDREKMLTEDIQAVLSGGISAPVLAECLSTLVEEFEEYMQSRLEGEMATKYTLGGRDRTLIISFLVWALCRDSQKFEEGYVSDLLDSLDYG